MDIIDRKTAMLAGRNTYYTGKTCKNGHTTYRYSASGTCAGCVAAARGSAPAARAPDLAAQPAPAHVDEMIETRYRAYHIDSPALINASVALAVARYPDANAAVFRIRATATNIAAGTGLYKVRVHPDDAAVMQQFANAMINARGHTAAEIAEIRRRAIGIAGSLMPPSEPGPYDSDPR